MGEALSGEVENTVKCKHHIRFAKGILGESRPPYYKQKEITNRLISEMLSLFSVGFQVRVKKLAMLAVIGLPIRAIIAHRNTPDSNRSRQRQ